MKHFIISLFLIGLAISSLNSFAQEKLLTADDAIYMNRSIYPSRIDQLQWFGTESDYAYVKDNRLYKVTAKKGEESIVTDLDEINGILNSMGVDSLRRLPSLECVTDEAARFVLKNRYYEFNIPQKTITQINEIPENADNIDFENDTRFIAYTIDNNLFYSIDGQSHQVTYDSLPGIVNGQTVHRVEFGIEKGIFWSPQSTMIAFYHKDESMVTDYPLVDITSRIATVKNTKYPMAGMTSEQVKLGVYNLKTGTIKYMNTGEPADQYLTAITWSPDESLIYIGVLNRDQDHLKLNAYDVNTGELAATLFEEEDPHYVEPEHPMYFVPDRPGQFVWFSERDGYNHLYLYDNHGKQIRKLTDGPWVVTSIIGFRGKELWFTGTKESPLENNVYTVNIDNGKIIRITPRHGTHHALVSKNGRYALDIFSSTEVTREYQLLDSKGAVIRVLLDDSNPLKDYNLGQMSIFTLPANDGTPLYCRMIKPIDFDSTRTYPVIVYVYGGPHAQLITDSWLGGAGLFLNYLAEQGYIIWTLDNRGSANRGRDFEQAIHRHLGEIEVQDQMTGVNYLKSLPYVDSTRIGVDGWSYGGFMTISLMLDYPDVFKVAVAGGPVIDWKYYEVMYGERYMDTPEQNPEGYASSSLLNKVDNLKGKMMIIHGTEDPTVVWQQSLAFLQSAIEHRKDIDYFVYPGHGHNMSGMDRAHLYEKISRYFNDFLK